jgi:hypothetical protein
MRYVVIANVKGKGRDIISQPMTQKQAETFKKNLESDLKMAVPKYQWASKIEVHPLNEIVKEIKMKELKNIKEEGIKETIRKIIREEIYKRKNVNENLLEFDYVKKFADATEKVNKKYKKLVGTRAKTPSGQEWEFVETNDMGVPYFVKVVNGKPQKKQFTVAIFGNKWLDQQLKKK